MMPEYNHKPITPENVQVGDWYVKLMEGMDKLVFTKVTGVGKSGFNYKGHVQGHEQFGEQIRGAVMHYEGRGKKRRLKVVYIGDGFLQTDYGRRIADQLEMLVWKPGPGFAMLKMEKTTIDATVELPWWIE